MLYRSDDYSSYKYLVSVSDNYVVLTDQHAVNGEWSDPETINVIYQYLSPSNLVLPGTRSYTSYQVFDNVNSYITNNDFERADLFNLYYLALFFIIAVLIIFNVVSKLFVKGGVLR